MSGVGRPVSDVAHRTLHVGGRASDVVSDGCVHESSRQLGCQTLF